jgi:hypothetical protein
LLDQVRKANIDRLLAKAKVNGLNAQEKEVLRKMLAGK